MFGHGVSVIIPVHNSAMFLGEAISSVLAQEVPPRQILVIDDGSSDATGRVARRFPVHYVRQARAGLAMARNRGVGLAKGSYVAFLDADDVWLPAKLRRQLDAFDDDPDLDLVAGHAAPLHDEYDFGRPTPSHVWGTLLVRRRSFIQVGPIISGADVDESTDWLLRAAKRS